MHSLFIPSILDFLISDLPSIYKNLINHSQSDNVSMIKNDYQLNFAWSRFFAPMQSIIGNQITWFAKSSTNDAKDRQNKSLGSRITFPSKCLKHEKTIDHVHFRYKDESQPDSKKTFSIQKSFHLLSEEKIVGKLIYTDEKITATAEVAGGSWIFRSTSHSAPNISIWTNKREFVAMFELNRIGSGNLLIKDGHQLKWEKTNNIPEEWCFFNTSSERIVKFLPEVSDFRKKGKAIIFPRSFTLPNLGVYVLLGWFTLSVLENGKSIKRITRRYTPW